MIFTERRIRSAGQFKDVRVLNCINWDHLNNQQRIKKAMHADEILLWPTTRIKESNLDGCRTGSNFKHLKDKWHWRKDRVNKGALEESLISAGMLTGKVSPVHAFSAGVRLPLPSQLSYALQIPNQIEGAFTLPAPYTLPASRFPLSVYAAFYRANATMERPSVRVQFFPPCEQHKAL